MNSLRVSAENSAIRVVVVAVGFETESFIRSRGHSTRVRFRENRLSWMNLNRLSN